MPLNLSAFQNNGLSGDTSLSDLPQQSSSLNLSAFGVEDEKKKKSELPFINSVKNAVTSAADTVNQVDKAIKDQKIQSIKSGIIDVIKQNIGIGETPLQKEIDKKINDFAVTIARSIPRSGVSAYLTATKQKQVTPGAGTGIISKAETTLLGKEPIGDFKTVGSKFLEDTGQPKEVASKYGFAVGALFAGMDLLPPTAGKEGVIAEIAKTTAPDIIASLLKTKIFKTAPDQIINSLAEKFSKINDPEIIKKELSKVETGIQEAQKIEEVAKGQKPQAAQAGLSDTGKAEKALIDTAKSYGVDSVIPNDKQLSEWTQNQILSGNKSVIEHLKKVEKAGKPISVSSHVAQQPIGEVGKELQSLANRAREYKDVNEFVADSIFGNSLNGSELKALSKFKGESTADKLEAFYKQTQQSISEANQPLKLSGAGTTEPSLSTSKSEPSLPVAGREEPSGATNRISGVSKSTQNNLSSNRINFLRSFDITTPSQEDYNRYYKKIQDSTPSFKQTGESIAKETGGNFVYRLKTQESLAIKLERKNQTIRRSLATMNDTLAGMVVTPDINKAVDLATKKGVKITTDYRKEPTFLGYKGVHADFETSGGAIGEIQFNTLEGLQRKEYAHTIYDKWRKYIENNGETKLNDVISKIPQNKKVEFFSDVQKSRDIYDGKITVPQEYVDRVDSLIKKSISETKTVSRQTILEKQQALKKIGEEELQVRRAEAELNLEKRSIYTNSQISDINRLKRIANSRKAQEGDIETLRKLNPDLTESVISHVREAKGYSMSDEEALREALSLPTLAETKAAIPSELVRARALGTQVKVFMQGVRTGTTKTKEQITEIQTSLLNLIRGSELELSDKGKLLALMKNVQTEPELEKAFVRVEGMINDVIKRNLKNDILDLQKKIINSPSIAIDYKNRVEQLTQGIALKGSRESTLLRLQNTQKYLQEEMARGKDVEVPSRILKSLELLNKVPLDQITTSQLEGIKAEMELLQEVGKTKLNTIQSLWNIQQNKILVDIAAQGQKQINNIPMIRPDIGERLTITQKFVNFIRTAQNNASRIDRSITPMDSIFDLLDGGHGTYTGANFRYFKARADAGYGRYLVRKNSLQKPVIDLISKFKLNDRNFERMGVVAAREQSGGLKKLMSLGYTEEQISKVTLSPREQTILDMMRSTFDSQFPEIQNIMRRVYNKEVEKVKNYFSFMTDWKAVDENEVFERFGSQGPDQYGAPSKNVEAGFTKSRVGGSQKIKINALDVFLQHTDNTSYLLELGETTKMLGEVAASDNYKNLVGDAGQLLVREWVDVMARKGGAAGAQQIAILDTLRKNVGAGILGLKLSTVAIQPTSLIDGAGFIGHPYMMKGFTNFIVNPSWRKFVLQMPEIKERMGGEFALRELTSNNWLESAQKKGFLAMEKLDQATAGAIAAGAYARKMKELGKVIDFNNYDKEALAYAQLAVRRTQSSGMFKDVPLAVSRGNLTGNRSLDRAMLQFQNFLLTRWSRVRHDAWRAGIMQGDPAKAIPVFTAIIFSAIMSSGIRVGVNEVQNLLTGKEDTMTPEDRFKQGIIYELTGNVPFLGTALSMAMYDGEMFPILDAPKGVIAGLDKAITAKKEETKLKGLSEFSGSLGAILGIPGAAQADILARGALSGGEGATTLKSKPSAGGFDRFLKKKTGASSFDRFLKKTKTTGGFDRFLK